jgi:hypothetical protein
MQKLRDQVMFFGSRKGRLTRVQKKRPSKAKLHSGFSHLYEEDESKPVLQGI